MLPNRVIPMFDSFLAERAAGQLDLVVVGGTALNLLRVVQRETRDCDVLAPTLAETVLQLSREFARAQRSAGEKLVDEWLNNGPASLVKQLPDGWEARLVDVFAGSVLTLRTLGRSDLLKTKLFAFCDRGFDEEDRLASRVAARSHVLGGDRALAEERWAPAAFSRAAPRPTARAR